MHDRDDKPSETVVRTVVTFTFPADAVRVAVPGATAFALKVAADASAATFTDAGTVTAPELLVNATERPPAGATEDSVTVQTVLPLVVTVVCRHVKFDGTTAAGTDNTAVFAELPAVAVMVTEPLAVAAAVALNVAWEDPAGIPTVAGT